MSYTLAEMLTVRSRGTHAESIEERFYALVRKKPVDKKRNCLKCGVVYTMNRASGHVCKACSVENARLGEVATFHNICI